MERNHYTVIIYRMYCMNSQINESHDFVNWLALRVNKREMYNLTNNLIITSRAMLILMWPAKIF